MIRRGLALIGLAGALAMGAAPAWAGKTGDAEAAFANGRDEEAQRLFTEAIAETASDPSAQAVAYFGRGEVNVRLRRQDQALADFTAALALPQDPESRANTLWSRAEVYSRRRMNDEALADYGESIRLQPNAIGVYLSRAGLLSRLKRKDEALADYDQALKINPKSARALVDRAVLLDLPIPETGMRVE
jgi:tetratricopeptide (TPR) repeat protein